jgi:hypothetical protein
MFIDSDIDFNAMDVLALLAFDKPIIGGPYPKKTIAWEKIYDAVKLGHGGRQPEQARTVRRRLRVQHRTRHDRTSAGPSGRSAGNRHRLHDGEARSVPAVPGSLSGTDVQAGSQPDAHFDGSREICAFFDTVIDRRPNPEKPDEIHRHARYLSEDYMFCQYARRIGIGVWLCPWMKLKHIGTYIFGGSVEALAQLSQVQAQRSAATPVAKDRDQAVETKVQ